MKREEVIAKLTNLGKKIEEDIKNGEGPKIKIPVRSLNNVNFNEKENLLELRDKKSTRSFLNIAHSKKFMQSLLIASKCKEFVERDKTASIRELYYQSSTYSWCKGVSTNYWNQCS